MKVQVTNYTPCPMMHISQCAGLCYGNEDGKPKRVENCVMKGHLSILEHASVSFTVKGISRACSHQLVRHRMASYCQESQRYNTYDLSNDDWFVVPPKIQDDEVLMGTFMMAMRNSAEDYQTMLNNGVKAEDARYLLPEATKTSIAVTMNWREIYHFLDLRTDIAAQWEIRTLANELLDELLSIDDLKPMASLWIKSFGGDWTEA